jgi:hypothetical protein
MAEPRLPNLPAHVGPCEFGTLGNWITVRCPRELAPLMRQAGGQWEPGSRCWLIEQRRIGPLIRALRRDTDPLFRRAGVSLDEGGR